MLPAICIGRRVDIVSADMVYDAAVSDDPCVRATSYQRNRKEQK